MTTVQTPPGVAALRGMGMDIDSPYAARPRGTLFPVGSYGHTGCTGCILWIDPHSQTFYVFLSNRVYPDDKANLLPLYTRIGTRAAESARLEKSLTCACRQATVRCLNAYRPTLSDLTLSY